MTDRAPIFQGLPIEAATGCFHCRWVDFSGEHFTKAVGVGSQAPGDGLVFDALQAHQTCGDGFFEVERNAFNRYRIEFYAREGVGKSSHGSFLLMVMSAATCIRALTLGTGVSETPVPHHSASGFLVRNRKMRFIHYILSKCCGLKVSYLWNCGETSFVRRASPQGDNSQNQSASRAGSTCGVRNLPLPESGGGLYSGHGVLPPARHGSAYRGAVLALLSGPRSSLLALWSAWTDRSCGVAA